MPRRVRIRDLKAQAQQTMDETQAALAHAQQTMTLADKAILQLLAKATATMVVVCEGLEEIMDGIELEATIMGKKMPISLQLKMREDEPIDTAKGT